MGDAKSGPYIIGFNGPPRSGKDTLATLLAGQINRFYGVPTHRCILAAAMRARVEALVGNGTHGWYEQEKDTPLDLLDGKTPRDCMIADSEEFLKPKYGRDFWAKIYHHKNQYHWGPNDVHICSDIGFSEEVQYFCENSRGYLNVMLAREGTDFSIDSRDYVDATPFGGETTYVENDSYPMAAVERILLTLQTLGWKL